MKKSLRSLAVLSVAALGLTSCVSKCTFAEFQDAYKNKESASYSSVSFSGKYNDTSFSGKSISAKDGEVSASIDAETIAATAVMALCSLELFIVAENTSYTYYSGSGFKVETDKEVKYEWNAAGYFLSYSDGTNSVKASWSK